MKKHNWKDVLLGALCAIMLFSLGMPAYAALTARKIDVYSGITIYKDDQLFVPRDVNGNAVDVKEQAVYIGKHSSDKPAVLLQDLTYFTGEKLYESDYLTDNLGNQQYQAIGNHWSNNFFENTYLINGQYTKMKGTFFQQFDHRSDEDENVLRIYGDGVLLKTMIVYGGVLPIDFEIDLTGVLELTVEIDNYNSYAAFTCGLYT